jgi:hypothetical protein
LIGRIRQFGQVRGPLLALRAQVSADKLAGRLFRIDHDRPGSSLTKNFSLISGSVVWPFATYDDARMI